MEPNFDIAALAAGAGASFVARETVAKPLLLDRLIERAIRKKGFALVEAMTTCPTTYGRRNKAGDAVEMTRDLRRRSVSRAAAEKLGPEERARRIVTGILVDVDKPEYVEEHTRLVERLRCQVSRPGRACAKLTPEIPLPDGSPV
jgi:2-oxoglutarate ferredoxin oxidoreductase subunit beta